MNLCPIITKLAMHAPKFRKSPLIPETDRKESRHVGHKGPV